MLGRHNCRVPRIWHFSRNSCRLAVAPLLAQQLAQDRGRLRDDPGDLAPHLARIHAGARKGRAEFVGSGGGGGGSCVGRPSGLLGPLRAAGVGGLAAQVPDAGADTLHGRGGSGC